LSWAESLKSGIALALDLLLVEVEGGVTMGLRCTWTQLQEAGDRAEELG
jgi:hypothetical protein